MLASQRPESTRGLLNGISSCGIAEQEALINMGKAHAAIMGRRRKRKSRKRFKDASERQNIYTRRYDSSASATVTVTATVMNQ